MLFMITYEISPENRDAVNKRFLETGGPPPTGAKMLGRWTSPGGQGFCLAESDDMIAIGKWIHDWSDLMPFEVFPVLTDEGIAEVIGPS